MLAVAAADAVIVYPPPSPNPLPLVVVAAGLQSPVDVVNAGDGSGRLFVVEKPGRVRVVRSGALAAQPFLDIATLVLSGDERGLLGVAFHPQFATTRYVYVNYTRKPDGATVVARYRVPEATPDAADAGSAQVLLVVAQRDGRPIASALALFDAGRLYGRYWGAVEHVPCLHFETAFYQSIEAAIELRVAVLEGGAQGEHKMSRGFLPEATHSAHWLAEPAFDDAVDRFLSREGAMIDGYIDELRISNAVRVPKGPPGGTLVMLK